MSWHCLCNSVEQPLPDAPGLLSCSRFFSNFVERFFLFTQLELKSLLLFLPADAHLHSLSGLSFAHPSSERARDVASVPSQNHVSRSQAGFRSRTAIINRAHGHRAARFSLRRKTEHCFLVFHCAQFESGKRKYLLIWQAVSAAAT